VTHIHSGRDLSGDVEVNPLFARRGELRTRPGTRLADLPMLPETA
jgi:glutamate decarboxylase